MIQQGMILMATSLLLTACVGKSEPQKPAAVGVKTLVVSATATDGRQAYSGTVEEAEGTSLSFPMGGTLNSLLVSEGQTVQAGRLVATVDGTSSGNAVTAAAAATRQAQDALAQAQDAHDRMQQLHANGSLPEINWVEVRTKLAQAKSLVRQAQATEQIVRKQAADTRLYAPFAGYVAQKTADVGQNVAPGQPVVRLVKIDRVKVKIAVPEHEIAGMQKGQTLRFSVAALGARVFTGSIVEKGVTAHPLSRSYEVKALVENPRHELLPGMVCDVTKATSERTALLLPADVVQIDERNRTFVWRVVGGKAVKTAITVGGNVGDKVVVESGLKSGDAVIVEGYQKVSEGTAVNV